MRILVTGAGGFIGGHAVDALLDRGHEVVGVEQPSATGPLARQRPVLAALAPRHGWTLVRRDLVTDPVDDLVAGVDAVVHLAGRPGVRPSWRDPAGYVAANAATTDRLAAAAAPGTRFVLAGSSSVYGSGAGPVAEDAPLRPASPYGESKVAAERALAGHADRVRGVVLRFFTVFGPRQRPDMAIARLVDAARTGQPFPLLGDGAQARALTYVDDVVDAIVRAGEADVGTGITTLNIGGADSVALTDVIDEVAALVGPVSLDIRPAARGDVDRTEADVRRAAEVLGWRPTTSWREGLVRQAAAVTDEALAG